MRRTARGLGITFIVSNLDALMIMIGEDCFVSIALISLYFQINSITGLSSLLMRVDVNPKLYVIISCSPRYATASHLVTFLFF